MSQADTQKPTKPYSDFPLFPHATKRWAKKIRGKLHYFGSWDDPDGALQKYLDERDDLQAGRVPRSRDKGGLTVADLCNKFMDSKEALHANGELSPRTLSDLHKSVLDVSRYFGKHQQVSDLTPADFEVLRGKLAKRFGAVELGNRIQKVRSVFKYGFDVGLMDVPVRFGPGFKKPSRRVIRKARNERGLRMFEADEVCRLLDAATGSMRCMILLAINCGYGQSDISGLQRKHLDLKAGWANYPRPKTEVQRRTPLWPETVAALREILDAERKAALDAEDDSCVFLTRQRRRWVRTQVVPNPKPGRPGLVEVDSVSLQFGKLLRELKIRRHGLGFYGFRRSFETVGGEARDQTALDSLMGHVDPSMGAVYRERISDHRLRAVVDHVHDWLWPKLENEAEAE